MKVITNTTVKKGKGKDAKYLAPGTHDFPDEVAKELIDRGHATPAVEEKKADDTKKDDTKKDDPPKA